MKKKKEIQPFNVVLWDINRDTVEHYNVMPYLLGEWEEESKRRAKAAKKVKNYRTMAGSDESKKVDPSTYTMPSTFEGVKAFLIDSARYQFWGRCEYEVILSGWPVKRNEYKIDAFEQIEMNIDVITKIFMDYISK